MPLISAVDVKVPTVLCDVFNENTHQPIHTRHLVVFAGPLPMEDIAKMADDCLRDIDEDEDDGNLEDDPDLLVFVQSFELVFKMQNYFFMFESK